MEQKFVIPRSSDDIIIVTNNITVGSDLIVTVYAKFDGLFNVNVGNYKTVVNITGDVGKVTIPILAAGTYNVNVSYVKDESIYANKTITVLKLNTNIVASNLVKYYFNNQKLSITLKDAKGNLLANQAVTLQIGTSKLTAKTNNKGVATFVNNKVGNYNAKLSFAGDSKYNPSTKSIPLK